MSTVSYYCNTSDLAMAFINRDYQLLHTKIMNGKVSYCENHNVHENEIFAYHIHKNLPLTKLYRFDIYMVDFVFSAVDTLHKPMQLEIITDLLSKLKKELQRMNAYFIFRIPTHIIDLIKAMNAIFTESIFCGGTVTYLSNPKKQNVSKNDDIQIISADQPFFDRHREELIALANASFANYQSQYFISPVTEELAPMIYSQWLENAFATKEDNALVNIALYNSEIAGFWIHEEDELCGQAVLAGVNGKFRGKNIYTTLFSQALERCHKQNKLLTAGTQFDNYIAQGTYGNLGLRPYMGYYNYHLDLRK